MSSRFKEAPNMEKKATKLIQHEGSINAGTELAELLEQIKPRLFDGPMVFDRNGASVGAVPANVLNAIESGTLDQAMINEFKERLDLSVAKQKVFWEIGEQLTEYLKAQGFIDSNHTFSGVALIDPNRAQKLLSMPDEVRQMVIASTTEERADFPIEIAPKFTRELSEEFAKYAGVPISIPFLSVGSVDPAMKMCVSDSRTTSLCVVFCVS
jgi:hypothetical protein